MVAPIHTAIINNAKHDSVTWETVSKPQSTKKLVIAPSNSNKNNEKESKKQETVNTLNTTTTTAIQEQPAVAKKTQELQN
jgi:hypothetical protein